MFECQVNEAMMAEMERRWRPSCAEVAPSCPRCASANTKFCYYNNYSLSQPRYFCKGCRRYWTKGGSLRNVPVGGGCRKTRRSKHKSNSSHLQATTPAGYSRENSSGDSNIDLAAVFANYLNSTPAEPGVSREKVSEPDSEDLGFLAEEKSGNESGEFEFGLGDGEDVMTGGDSMMWWQDHGESSLMNESVWSGFDFAGFEIFSSSS